VAAVEPAEVAVDQLFYYKTIHCKLWLQVAVVAVAAVTLVLVALVQGHTVRLPQDSMAKQEHHIQPMVVVVVAEEAGIMVVPVVVATGVHMAGGLAQAIPVVRQETRVLVGVFSIPMALLLTVELLAVNQVSMFRVM
jgi:hypothetical protein